MGPSQWLYDRHLRDRRPAKPDAHVVNAVAPMSVTGQSTPPIVSLAHVATMTLIRNKKQQHDALAPVHVPVMVAFHEPLDVQVRCTHPT